MANTISSPKNARLPHGTKLSAESSASVCVDLVVSIRTSLPAKVRNLFQIKMIFPRIRSKGGLMKPPLIRDVSCLLPSELIAQAQKSYGPNTESPIAIACRLRDLCSPAKRSSRCHIAFRGAGEVETPFNT